MLSCNFARFPIFSVAAARLFGPSFLPRDAMHSAAHAVGRSIHPSIRISHSCIVSKQLKRYYQSHHGNSRGGGVFLRSGTPWRPRIEGRSPARSILGVSPNYAHVLWRRTITSSVLLNSRNCKKMHCQFAWWRQTDLHTSWRAKSSDRV